MMFQHEGVSTFGVDPLMQCNLDQSVQVFFIGFDLCQLVFRGNPISDRSEIHPAFPNRALA